jgi:hypothetical protein
MRYCLKCILQHIQRHTTEVEEVFEENVARLDMPYVLLRKPGDGIVGQRLGEV